MKNLGETSDLSTLMHESPEPEQVSERASEPKAKRRTAPSYAGCRPASALASGIKRRNRKTGTRAELALRRALWRLGLRYRLNDARLPGRPDLVLPRYRAVVFVDGDFWHGRDWEARSARLKEGSNAAYWVAKIAYNRERDRRNDALLAGLGWRVRRLWETDVLKDPGGAAAELADWLRSPGRSGHSAAVASRACGGIGPEISA